MVRRKLDCFWGEILRHLSGNYIEDEFRSTNSKPNLMSLTWLEGVNQALDFQKTMIKKLLVEILSKLKDGMGRFQKLRRWNFRWLRAPIYSSPGPLILVTLKFTLILCDTKNFLLLYNTNYC